MFTLSRLFPKLILIPYLIMVGCGLMLPSDGYHGMMSPKSLSFLTTSYLILLYFFYKNRFTYYQYKLIGFTFLALSALLLWLFIGTANQFETGFSAAFDQFKIFFITIIFTVVTLYMISELIISRESFLKAVIWTNLFYSIIKICGVTLHFIGFLKLITLMEKMGIRVMSMHITEGISRLQTSVDIITPFLIYFVLQSTRLNLNFGKVFKCFFILVSILSIMLSFSRFLLAVAFVGIFFYWLTLSASRFVKGLLFCFILTFTAVSYIGIDQTIKIIKLRFDSRDSFASDQVRTEQIEALMREYDSYPLLGKGLGGNAPAYLRDGEITHSYEVQWVSFLMQFGAIGFILLLIPTGFIGIRFLQPPVSRINIGFFFLFVIWMLSGFTNPYMISLTSGIVYSTFIVAADLLGKKKDLEPLRNR